MARKSTKLPTKKGPKGKKARRAAKLNRQWGEEVDEEQIRQAKIRKGKRRLVISSTAVAEKVRGEGSDQGQSKKRKQLHPNGITDDRDGDREINSSGGSDDESDFENSIESNISNSHALSSLLKNIDSNKNSKKKTSYDMKRMKHLNSNDADGNNIDYSSEESHEGESEDSHEDDEPATEDEGDDSREIMSKLTPIGPNPFHTHFRKGPLAEGVDTSTIVDGQTPQPTPTKMKKVRTDQLHPSLVLQLSGNVLEKYNLYAKTDVNDVGIQQMSQRPFSHVQPIIVSNWRAFNRKALRRNVDCSKDDDNKHDDTRNADLVTQLQDTIYSSLSTYADAQFTCATRRNTDAINNIVTLHVLNHVLTANHDITSHNNRIRDRDGEEDEDEDEFRDQGYTRPKVLILLPTKSTAFSFVKGLLKLLGINSFVDNLERFDEEFGNLDEDTDISKDGKKNNDSESNSNVDSRRKSVLDAKGKDWNELFADHVNSDDDFKIGMSFSRKKKIGKKRESGHDEPGGVALKLYSDYYHSDIIVASPLGIKMSITTTTDDDEEEEGDADFLSSIEVAVVLHSDVMLMQNWDHITDLMGRVNHQPRESKRTDFSRVRNYLLEGQAARWRQLILVSRFSDPHLLSMFNRHAKSIAGRVKLRRKVAADEASICNVMAKVRQVFQRVQCESFNVQGDKRLKYFTSVILPQLLRTKQKHTLVYIPSYFDFVAVRNVLLKHDVASSHFVSITEYSRTTEVTRGRTRFLQGRKRIMLYTGRAHFFMRHHIKGAKHLIMFGLPEHAEFYPELLNMLSWRSSSTIDEDDDKDKLDIEAPASCLNVFTKYDAHSLERIVGTKHSDRMIKGEKSTYLFSS